MVELLLRGFQARPPAGDWVLWGPPAVEPLAWRGARIEPYASRPNRWRGQRDWLRVPSADLVVFMHQQRPLCPVRALTTILDTTPLHFPSGRADQVLKSRFLRAAAASSAGILTISQFARRSIVDDLGVPEDKIEVLSIPADADLAARVLARRATAKAADTALYLGLFLPHKNLPRLVEAFGRTAFCRHGGRLLLVGGKDLAPALEASLSDRQRRFVEVRARATRAEIEELLATARFLVQPSLVEGFGLPVWEALGSGLPVCASDGGSLPEITYGLVDHFPARSASAMAEAIDECATRAEAMTEADHLALSRRLLARAPSVAAFASQFEALVARHLSRSRTAPRSRGTGAGTRPRRTGRPTTG